MPKHAHINRLSISTRLGVMSLAVAIAATGVYAQTPVTPPGSGAWGDPYQISQLGHLVWIGFNVNTSNLKYYKLQNDIDASATATWDSGMGWEPDGFDPIGRTPSGPFRGRFDGNGKVIRNLMINRPGSGYVGLFAQVGSSLVADQAQVKNLALVDCSVTGGPDFAGGLVGRNFGTVDRCYVTGTVMGSGGTLGGLVGGNYGAVTNCHTACTVTGGSSAGGLIGGNHGRVSACYSMGAVTGNDCVGGLVGYNGYPFVDELGTVDNCYAKGTVTGGGCVGGLAGVNGGFSVGYSSIIRNSYATGRVTGNSSVAGLVGFIQTVVPDGALINCYWDTNTTGQIIAANGGCDADSPGNGKTTTQMKQQATFVGWNFTTVWSIHENSTSPFLQWQGPFAGSADLGGGWKWLAWFGLFNINSDPWIWHNEHGWMYTPSTTFSDIWFYTFDMGWLWTSSNAYPSLYRSSNGQWLWYQKDSDSPRWFYNFGTSVWESH